MFATDEMASRTMLAQRYGEGEATHDVTSSNLPRRVYAEGDLHRNQSLDDRRTPGMRGSNRTVSVRRSFPSRTR